MNLNKIGTFVTEMRKIKGLTQNELAEKLAVTDKAVSKWECGKGLPDVATMMPLCDLLGITINELLNGEKIAEAERTCTAEKQTIELLRERQANKRQVWWQIVIGLSGSLFLLGILVLTAVLLDEKVIEMYSAIPIMIVAVFLFITLITVIISIALGTGSFECQNCNHRFMPTPSEYIEGLHTITRRKLKCPKCGKITWCRQRLDK